MKIISPREANSEIFVMNQRNYGINREISIRGYGFLLLLKLDLTGNKSLEFLQSKYNSKLKRFENCRFDQLSEEFSTKIVPKLKNIDIIKEYYGDTWESLDALKLIATISRS